MPEGPLGHSYILPQMCPNEAIRWTDRAVRAPIAQMLARGVLGSPTGHLSASALRCNLLAFLAAAMTHKVVWVPFAGLQTVIACSPTQIAYSGWIGPRINIEQKPSILQLGFE